MKSLTREQTAGTLTFFFPERRDATTPPEVTIIVRRVGEEEWHAGLAMCSKRDMFDKKVGRKIAFHRLGACPVSGENPLRLLMQIVTRLDAVTRRHPYTFTARAIQGIPDLGRRLEAMRVE